MAVAPIHTILAYQAADGERFHDLADAQAHTRRNLHAAILTAAFKSDSKFAPLVAQSDLICDFLMAYDRQVADVVADKMAPVALPEATVRQHARVYDKPVDVTFITTPKGMPKAEQIKPDAIKSQVEAFEAEIETAFEDEMKHAQHSG